MRTLRHLALALAWGCSLLGVVLVLLYVMPETQASLSWVAMAAAFIPYGIALWLAALILFLVAGQRWTKALALPVLVALIVQVGWARPYWPVATSATPNPGRSTSVRVLAANVHYGKADPSSLAQAIAATDPDVVIVIEASDPFLDSDALSAAWASRPHRVGRAVAGYERAGREDPSGAVVVSRLPLTEVSRIPSSLDQYIVKVGAGDTPLTLVTAHPLNMVPGARLWEREGHVLRDAIRPHLDEPLAVVGDFNATLEHLTLRGLLDEGLAVGAQDAGAGWQPTFGAHVVGVPVIAIDHVLTSSRVATTSYRTIPIARSDHRAILADLTYG